MTPILIRAHVVPEVYFWKNRRGLGKARSFVTVGEDNRRQEALHEAGTG